MTTFVDTSALLAILDADDAFHEPAARAWEGLLSSDSELITTNYVLVEAFAVVQRRLGMKAVRSLATELVPVLDIVWIDSTSHEQAAAVLSTSSRRGLSLVDCASFAAMRSLGVERAFCFDSDFSDQGFERVPASPAG